MVAARNLFSAHLCPGASWTKETLDIPLETDEMIIDYLSRFDGDADKAYFALMVELGSGKGIIILLYSRYHIIVFSLITHDIHYFIIEHVFSQRAVEQVKRHSAGTTFMESRERYLLAPPTAAAGMLVCAATGGVADGLVSESGNEAVRSPHTLARSRYLGGKSPANVGIRPLSLVDDSIQQQTDNGTSVATKEEVVAESHAPEPTEVPQSTEGRGVGSSRTAGLNNDKESKNSVRKEWQAIYKQVSDLLARCAGPRHAPTLPGAKIVTDEEALVLLRTAATLPTYINSPGECFAETVRTALGELLLHCATTHKWCIDVRDALYDSVVPPVTLSRFTALLNESRSLRVVNEPVLKQLQQIVAERSNLARSVRQLDRFVSLGSTADEDDAVDDAEATEAVPAMLSLQDVRDFLHRDAKLPRAGALHGHTELLKSVVASVDNLAQWMDTLIIKAEICSVRKQRYFYFYFDNNIYILYFTLFGFDFSGYH